MKLAELGLKTKPATKCFEHGYISFSTANKELFYQIWMQTKTRKGSLESGRVRDQEHLKQLLALKTLKEAVNL